MSNPDSLLAQSFRKLYSHLPLDALKLIEMGIELPWSLVCDKEFFDLGLHRGLSEKERFVEILSYKVPTHLACPLLYEQDTLQLERFRLQEEEVEQLVWQHNINFYRERFVLGWRVFPYKSIVYHFLPYAGIDELLEDPVLLNFYSASANYASFLSIYKPVHYLLSNSNLEDILGAKGLSSPDLCRTLELKIIYDREGKEALDALLSLSQERGYLPKKVNQALLVHGQGVLERGDVSDMTALAFSCQHRHLQRIPKDIPRLDLFLSAFEGWLHHRRTDDFYHTSKAILRRINREERIKICQFSCGLPVDVVEYLLSIVDEKVYFLKGVLVNNKGYTSVVRFCEIKLQELASSGQGLSLPPLT